VENTLAPLAVFSIVLRTAGLFWAVVGALALCYGTILVRLVRRAPVPALLLVGAVLLTARSAVGALTGSAFLYFLQPSLGNFVMGAVFLLSVLLGRPLAARLAGEFCALPADLVGHHRLRAFFRQVSLLWAVVFCAIGAVTVVMLLTVPVSAFVLLSSGSSTFLIVVAIGLSLWWFRRSLRQAGVRLRLGPAVAPVT
jgi:intracellular septation protein A